MKKLTFLKSLLLGVGLLAGNIGAWAQSCDITDDFVTLTANTSYKTVTTTGGWTAVNAAVQQGGTTNSNPTFSFIGPDANTKAVCINGKTSAVGIITSPTLSGGCFSISFKYGHAFSESNGAKFTVEIKQNGATVWSEQVVNTSMAQYTAYEYSKTGLAIEGDFTLVITNNSPSNQDANKDRVSIWGICITNYSGTPVPTITVTETTLEGFSYEVGKGPSAEKSFQVSGNNLTGNITLTPSDNLEISTGSGENFVATSPINLPPTEGVVAATSIYARLKAGLSAGNYTETITATSPGAVTKTITCKGNVFEPVGTVPNVIITEVYGGGGNSGAELKNDFIELYNTTDTPVEIGEWIVEYFSAGGTGTPSQSNIFVIPTGKSIPAYTHFLIQCAAGNSGTQDLPTPDATCELALSGTSGKVILYTTSEPQAITTDITSITGNPYFKDYVPYGTTAVPVWGTAMSSNTSNTTSAARKIISDATPRIYQYTGNIGNDFEVATPTPQNTQWTAGIKNVFENLNVYVADGKIHINTTTVGEQIEVYNTLGQRLVNVLSTGEENIISVNAKGVLLVKCGNKVGKVIL